MKLFNKYFLYSFFFVLFSINGVHVHAFYISDLNNNDINDNEELEVVVDSDKILPPGEYEFNDLVITNNATLTLEGAPESTNDFKGVKITAKNITINSSSTISANSQGYSYLSGPGFGYMNNGGYYGGIGASHGGYGGHTCDLDPAPLYGSSTAPIDLGSGGPLTWSSLRGGGAIRIIVANTFINNGVISSDGAQTTSGGSIYITTDNFEGSGSIHANGGNEIWVVWWYPGAGGGRVAVYYKTSTFSGSIDALGGGGNLYGENGTVFVQQQTPEIVPTCCSNVLFIPGLEGSRLYKKDSISENQLWEPNRNADVEKLYMDSNGNSLNSDIYTRDIINRTNIGLGTWDQNVYQGLSNLLNNLATDTKINGWESLPYDWRNDLNKIISDGSTLEDGSKLNFVDEVIKMASSSQTKKVTVITHSNGGLIAKVLIDKLRELGKEDLIDKLIMVAAPQLGTPSAITAMLHGDGQEIPAIGGYYFLKKDIARTLGENMPGAYNLLPETNYFNAIASPVIKFDQSLDELNDFRIKYGNVVDNYSTLRNFILGGDGRSEPDNSNTMLPNVLRESLLQTAENNHNVLDNWIPSADIRTIQLAGWGIKTLSGTEYYKKDGCVFDFELICIPKSYLDRRPILTEDGDDTVVTPSAVSIGSAEKYYLNLKDMDSKYHHLNIFEATSTLEFIQNYILDSDNNLPQYITTEKPVSTDKIFELSMHSPVSIDVYDSKGNHTGIINNPNSESDLELVEEGISGSRYLNFGEGKYVYLNEGENYTIKFKGLDTGFFTFQANVVSNNGDTINKIEYKNISTSKDMIGEMLISGDAPISTTTILKIDSNGDGETDFNIQPNETIDTIPPLITILGENPITIKIREDYLDPGVLAIDEINGDITHLVSTSTDLDNSRVGEYNFNYSITDSSGNISTTSRIINVVAGRKNRNVNSTSDSFDSENDINNNFENKSQVVSNIATETDNVVSTTSVNNIQNIEKQNTSSTSDATTSVIIIYRPGIKVEDDLKIQKTSSEEKISSNSLSAKDIKANITQEITIKVKKADVILTASVGTEENFSFLEKLFDFIESFINYMGFYF